jgi:carbonic anhydrase
MTRIIQGVLDFQQRVFDSKFELFQRLRDGQQPLALFITCADSRIDPNLLTQTEPGELFVLRNAGNIVPPWTQHAGGESATIDYAVDELKVRDIVLCGHARCGAMNALLASPETLESPAIKSWLKFAEPSVQRARRRTPTNDRESIMQAIIEQNVLLQIEHLQTYPSVHAAMIEGRLRLHAWVYQFDVGQVTAYDSAQDCFVSLPPSSGNKFLVPISQE